MTQQGFSIEQDRTFLKQIERELEDARRRQAELIARRRNLNEEMMRQAELVRSLEIILQRKTMDASVSLATKRKMGRPAGNASIDKPARRGEYARLSVLEALHFLVETAASPLSSDDLARQIWHVSDQIDLRKVRPTLASDIARAYRTHLIDKVLHEGRIKYSKLDREEKVG